MIHSYQNQETPPDKRPHTIFLPGWAFDGRILQLFKPVPSWIYPEKLLDPTTMDQDLLELIPKNTGKFRLVGWSMGGMLGMRFAARHSGLVDSLILVSLRSHWPGNEIDAIRSEFCQNPEAFLKGFYRKCFLGDKQAYMAFCAHLEPLYLAAIKENFEKLLRGLDFLSTFEVSGPLPEIPTKLIHGRQDIIAPVEDMPILPGTDAEIIDNAGHLPFLHENCSLQHEIKKQEILVKFSRAADSYDNYAKVQGEIARRLTVNISGIAEKAGIKTILEIGCGTGNFTAQLAAIFPTAKIAALDFSPEMIAIARHKLNKPDIEFICAEAELFLQNTQDKSFDLVVSNGALQWFFTIDKAMQNIARILTSAGNMFCSIFGPQSLKELAEGLHATQTLKEGLAARTFPGPEKLAKALGVNFSKSALTAEYIEKEYSSAHDLLLHIKKTGTSGWHRKIHHPLTPSRVSRLDEWFIKTYGACKVTYQVFFLQGKK